MIETIYEKQQQQLVQIKQKCQEASKKFKNALQEGAATKIKNNEIFSISNNIYRLCEQDNQEVHLYQSKYMTVEEQLKEIYQDLLKEFINDIYYQVDKFNQEKESVLFIVTKTYHDYKAYSNSLYQMFCRLDKKFTSVSQTFLMDLSIKLFKMEYFDKFNKLILNTILQFIQETRKYGILLNKQIKQLVELFSIMGSKEVELKYIRESGYFYISKKKEDAQRFYEEQFQSHLLTETLKYYKKEIDDKLNLTTIEFINWINSIFKLEQDMCLECYPISYQVLKKELEIILVNNQAARLIDSPTGLSYMLQYDQTDELKLLFKFLAQNNQCRIYISKYFEQKGQPLNNSILNQEQMEQQKNEAELYFTNILLLMEKAEDIFKNQLEKEPEVQSLYEEAIMYLINKHEKSPKFLAIYIDIIIRREKGRKEIEGDKRLPQIVSLFKLLYQRDIFFNHYYKLLSKRLLNQQTQDLQLEKQLIQKFKGQVGSNVLPKLSTMIQDIELSNRFTIDQSLSKDIQFDLNVVLLTNGCWPIITNIQDNIIRPLEIQNSLENYKKMFEDQNKERRIEWQLNLGQGELIYKMQTEKYILILNTMQMIAILQFNKADSFSIKKILDMTNIDKKILENSLIPFVCMKIITREKQDIEDFSDENEVLKLNMSFTKRAKKIQLLPNYKMQPKRANNDKEEKEEKQQLQKQRESVVDSQLVKLMKINKTINHQNLLQNCQNAISIFRPDEKFIKNRIEYLIEKEYIVRDENKLNVYRYQN
ncbi:unnamed protein product [Paramecium octaurelia]|uniref:Cullin family profile domain-containing protein n=1 Tax=Paramecium octaurelia TaxID=43137 RepID=A0A8S1W0N8_PAROT|nr:unnamed protein product [Paramecium octaurelia]